MEYPVIRFTITVYGFGFWDFDDSNIILLSHKVARRRWLLANWYAPVVIEDVK